MRRRTFITGLAGAAAWPLVVRAQEPAARPQEPAPSAPAFERAATFNVQRIAGIKPSGPNYTIASPVTSDGFMRIYALKTSYGDYTVIGDALMRARIVELAAIAELEKISTSDTFNKALLDAGLAPVRFAGDLVTNPGETINNTVSGIGSMLGQIGSGLSNMGKSRDDTVQSLIGASKKKRELAVKLGVDPYTDFEPLANRLSELAQAAATGGLVVSAALMAVPGVGGLVVSNVATTSTIESMAVDRSPDQLMDINRQKLAAMGIDATLANALLANRNYTPLDTTIMVHMLDIMPNVGGRDIFVAKAASAHRRDAAYFMRRQAEMLAEFQSKSGTLTGFIGLGGFPFNEVRGGGIVGIVPLDAVSWTQGTARSMKDISDGLKRSARAGRAELRISGQATVLAKQQLTALGWTTVVENYRP